jgi:transcriptional regulator with XRE-family HTH domain
MGLLVHDFQQKMMYLLGDARAEIGARSSLPLPSSQAELAALIGVPRNTLNQWIKQKVYPDHMAILNIARFYGFGPTDEFLRHQQSVPDALKTWFDSKWRCWHDPQRKGGTHEGPDNFEKFRSFYISELEIGNLIFQKPIKNKDKNSDDGLFRLEYLEIDYDRYKLEQYRSKILDRIISLDLTNKQNKTNAYFDLLISIITEGKTPFYGTTVGINEVEVAIKFESCRIRQKETPEMTRPALKAGGLRLEPEGAVVRALGSVQNPIWVFEALDEHLPLRGVYTTACPPACELEVQKDQWDVFAEAVIRPMNLYFPPQTDNVVKTRIVDRLRALALFRDDEELVAHSVSLRVSKLAR